ncbi:hypothetical protein [Candidatus Ruminimicrobium bovinum]|uniref:hypothetical protein n=1 Tax=Candidatus Ruminimicrobium bovinum TaxID=3242779 RepID=UPI0039B9AB9E
MTKTINKTTKILLAVAFMFVAIMGTASKIYAADTYKGTIVTSTTWTTLAESTTGFNRNVTVFNSSTGTDGLGILRADIRMLGKNGNVVWSETKACPGYGTREFWCGSDVYKIQIRVAYASGTAYAYPS